MSDHQPHPDDRDTHAIPIETDTASESELYEHDSDSEDGGMQLDPPVTNLALALTIAREMDLEREQVENRPRQHEESETEYTRHPPNPFGAVPNGHNVPLSQDMMFSTEDEEQDDQIPDPDPFRLRMRTRMREEEHAALAILSDWELLVTYALTSRRTIPQTRRHFQSKLLSPHNSQRADDLYAARFAVPASKAGVVSGLNSPRTGPGAPELATGNSCEAFLVPGSWREVVCRDGEGWWAPGQVRGKSGRSGRDSRGKGR